MPQRRPALAPLTVIAAGLAVAASLLPAAAQAPAGDVTIYRCTDAAGRTSIGNLPCAAGDTQETRGMVRPVDGPPRRAAPAVAAEPAPEPPPRVVVLREPRPLYECVTPEGQRYDSDDGEGNPRWVPYWTTGDGYYDRGYGGGIAGGRDGGSGLSVPGGSGLSAPGSARISASTSSDVSAPIPGGGARPPSSIGRPPSGPRPPSGWRDDVAYGGTWIRDDCQRLPRAEACARLDDRLDDSRRRFFNAQQRERDVLRVEERALVARLAEDCG